MDRNDLIASPTHKELDIQHQIYNGVPVLELMINGQSIMRRISDGYMNATHILSQAGLSKGQRTKALEQFIQIHHQFDKVQGGYGRYQGTWYFT